MKYPYNRRTILKTIGAGSITTTIAGCSGNGGDGGGGEATATATATESDGEAGEPNHDVPHPENDTVPDAEATGESLSGGQREPGNQSEPDNASVMLQHTPSGGQSCGSCALYVPDENGDGYGACTSVAGKIHPCDWCLLYTEYSGGDWENPCEQV
ncbi:high-potential iron-sulfur protein [Haloplanus aerogenes]|uniref:High potential iron-sulfur proteins family profile domain-containing protein n=1 Tax=Haloplanus aerogenes TaxID=660522 RepID=A0A3M0CPW3_9EURY|nr:high-potential iron-sulfur protein [Haloplanus aerogenes]AZH25954.1 hypothetical protein DU502_11480 [Haloplanus aerogenes]RMB11651.1 hypothetical protein ATH50_3350 [Haloplanus aerogenes]